LLEREGIRVHFPAQQTCCGQPAHSSGFPDEARAVVVRQLELFPQPWPVVVPSGSCAGMMRHHWAPLFADNPGLQAEATQVAERVYELTEFLVHIADYQPRDLGPTCSVALHTSCQARREMGVHATSMALLERLEHVTVQLPPRAEECCGFGGTFAIRYPDISAAIASDKVAALRSTGADRVVSADCGCLLNILGRAARLDEEAARANPSLPGEHIASFLWRRTSEDAA
jgi:L-lactate dehydrogenase complex protein LldE